MSFCEAEIARKIAFDLVGGPAFNTDIRAQQSGSEERNRNWLNPRREWEATSSMTDDTEETRLALVSDMEMFFLLLGGPADAFRFFWELDCSAVGEPMAMIDSTHWQLQRTYSRFGRTYVRTITKPITSAVLDYQGNPLANTVTIHPAGGTFTSMDHTTGIATFSVAPSGTPTADFEYHIPVRFVHDKFQPQIAKGAKGSRIIKWNSLGLIEVRPPKY